MTALEAAIMMTIPLSWQADPDKALPDSALMRGPYVNSGSKDVGPDPKAGTYEVGRYSK